MSSWSKSRCWHNICLSRCIVFFFLLTYLICRKKVIGSYAPKSADSHLCQISCAPVVYFDYNDLSSVSEDPLTPFLAIKAKNQSLVIKTEIMDDSYALCTPPKLGAKMDQSICFSSPIIISSKESDHLTPKARHPKSDSSSKLKWFDSCILWFSIANVFLCHRSPLKIKYSTKGQNHKNHIQALKTACEASDMWVNIAWLSSCLIFCNRSAGNEFDKLLESIIPSPSKFIWQWTSQVHKWLFIMGNHT